MPTVLESAMKIARQLPTPMAPLSFGLNLVVPAAMSVACPKQPSPSPAAKEVESFHTAGATGLIPVPPTNKNRYLSAKSQGSRALYGTLYGNIRR